MELSGRYANFIAIGLGLIAFVTAVTTFNSKVSAMELATSEAMAVATVAKTMVEVERGKNEQRDEILAQLSAQVGNIYKRGLVIQGKALVLDVGDEPYVEINTRDPNGPVRLKGFEELHVTNLTHPDMIMGEMEIRGGFSNATPGYVFNLSKAAGELLHVRPGQWIEVRVEPIFDEVVK